MIDSTTVQTVVNNALKGDIALQTVLLVVCLEGISLFKKYGPIIIPYLKGNGPSKKTIPMVCQDHATIMTLTQETSIAVKELTRRADQHHSEQRQDFMDLKDTMETDLREIRKCTDEQGTEIAEHRIAISFLRENDRAHSVT